jgi:hypothetical protein
MGVYFTWARFPFLFCDRTIHSNTGDYQHCIINHQIPRFRCYWASYCAFNVRLPCCFFFNTLTHIVIGIGFEPSVNVFIVGRRNHNWRQADSRKPRPNREPLNMNRAVLFWSSRDMIAPLCLSLQPSFTLWEVSLENRVTARLRSLLCSLCRCLRNTINAVWQIVSIKRHAIKRTAWWLSPYDLMR